MTEPSARRPDASMTLLTEVMNRPLDPGYAAAAERRRERDLPPGQGTRGRSPLAVLILVLVGVLLAAAWAQTRQARPADTTERQQLAAEITRQDAAAGALQRRNEALLVQIEAERSRLLDLQAEGGLADELATLGLVTGAVAAAGPGITVTLDDADTAKATSDGSNPRAGQESDNGRVLDQDLQVVVNGLWDAGAEGIAINGQRLTTLSAIRSAGQAILVDYRPLKPPYRIAAIGDPGSLQTRFSDGAGGRDMQYLKDNFGIKVDISSAKRLVLPASAALDTRRAKAIVPGRATPSASAPAPGSTATTKPMPQETP